MSERKFKTEQDFVDKVKEYIMDCDIRKRLPNIAGFAVFCDMNVDTFYAQQEYYSEAYKKVQAILEDEVINNKSDTTLKIFYMKNKFGYKDRQEIDADVRTTEIRVELDD